MDMPSQHGYFTVVATSEGMTTLQIQVPVLSDPLNGNSTVFEPGKVGTLSLQQYEVAQISASGAVGSGLGMSGASVSR